MIYEIEISHYKSISSVSVSLGPVNVFVGKNGSGKSNVVDALSFLSDIASEDLDYAMTKRHGADSVRQWSKRKPFHVTINAKISNEYGNGQYKIVFSSSRNNYRILEEIIEWEGRAGRSPDEHHTILSRGKSGHIEFRTTSKDIEFDSNELSSERRDTTNTILHRIAHRYIDVYWLVRHIHSELLSQSTYSIFPNTIRSPQAVSRSVHLEYDGSNIASVLKQMSPDKKRRIVKSLRSVIPNLVNISTRSAAGYYVPAFTVRDKLTDESHELNMSQISDGTLRILGILVAFYQDYSPTKIVIEEPEQMIHPALLMVIKDAVDNYLADRKNGQVFITTHSSILMDLFETSEIVAVEYDGISTKAGPVSERQKKVVQSGLMTLGDVLLAEGLEVG